MGVTYRNIADLASEVARSRPRADVNLEQFHMTESCAIEQAQYLGQVFDGRGVVFLGDDDHISVLVAAFFDICPIVYEVDDRIVRSLTSWAEMLQLRQYRVVSHDLREPLDRSGYDAFYMNPPFSSKSGGYAIKLWLTRALESVDSWAEGVLVMPSDADIEWVNQTWLTIQEFLSHNGCRILSELSGSRRQYYEGTNDRGLSSENLFIRRVDPSRLLKVDAKAGRALYA